MTLLRREVTMDEMRQRLLELESDRFWEKLAKRWFLTQVVTAELADTGWWVCESVHDVSLVLPARWMGELPPVPLELRPVGLRRS